jgi:outer membrane protein assembly factor BamB
LEEGVSPFGNRQSAIGNRNRKSPEVTMRSVAVAGLVLGLTAAGLAGDWPQWRGPGRDGRCDPTGLVTSFPPGGLKPRWQKPLGGGYGGIAVAAGRVYVMDRLTQPAEVERVVCLDAATGETVWTHADPVAYGKMEYGNGPRCTPTVHEGRVYTLGARGRLLCLDAADGRVVWERDTVRDFQGRVPTWGHACSPLVDGDRLVVQVGGTPDACLVALDRHTGRELWRALPDRPGYSSPVILAVGGRRLLLYWTAENVAGLDPATGKVLWTVPFNSTYDVAISDPIFHEGVVFVSGYWEGSKAIRLDGRGENPQVLWEGRPLFQLMATPLFRDGYLYALDKNRGLKCVELKTGRVLWEDEHVTPRDRNPHAALVWAGEKALIFNTPGELIWADLSPGGYKELAKTKVSDRTWSHPAFADRCVFARDDAKIVCVPLSGG